MRVARLYRWGDVRIEEMPVPRPGRGEALVRIEACGVCGTDALVWYVERKAPAVLGYEPAGVVVAVGHGVESVRPGDRVFVHHHAPCMECAECRRGLWSSCATWRATSLDPGAFAEYVRVPAINLERDTLVLPDAMSFDQAVFIEPLATCIRAVRRQGRLEPGDAVLVIGLGSMGLLMLSTARAYGAGTVLGSDFAADRRDIALRRGADAVYDPGVEDVTSAVRAATQGRGADVVVVCPGDAGAIRARAGGRRVGAGEWRRGRRRPGGGGGADGRQGGGGGGQPPGGRGGRGGGGGGGRGAGQGGGGGGGGGRGRKSGRGDRGRGR